MTSSSPEYNVFVSYSRKNKDLAERLDGYLKAWKAIVPDLRYFIDSKLDLGDKVTPTIEKALSDSCVYLLIATPKYFQDGYAGSKELPLITKEKEKDANKAIVILAYEYSESYLSSNQLGDIVRLDFSDESKHEENYDLLLQSLKKKLATMEAPASPTYPASKEAKRLEEQGNHYTDVAVEINLGVRGAPLHVIGWKGIEIDDIYKGFENVNCLVTERSFDSPPTLQFRQNVFNVIVADAELLERYASLGAVQNLQHLTTRVRDMFDQDPISLIKNRISQKSPIGGLYDNHLHGIPLQFGFNELLVNVDGLNKGALKEKFDRATKRVVTNLRYKDFDIKNLLETDQVKKIGLWNWYLPTFCHLLMCDGAQSDLTSVAQFYEKTTTLKKDDQTIKNFSAELVALAEKYRSKIILLRSLEQASRALLRGEIGVMFGGSSALLEQGSVAMPLQGSIKLVIPQEGLFMWVNCGAVLNPPMGRYEDLLVYWLCPETQVRLWKCNTAFKGFPVRKDSILRILTEEPFHNSFLTLARTMTRDEARWFLDREQSGVDPNSRAFFDTLRSQRRGGVNEVPVSFRPFPNTQWRHWTETWEAIVSTLKGAATEKVS